MKLLEANTNGHYSPGVISNGMLYISGQLSLNPLTRKLPEGGIKAHAWQALNNMDAVLQLANVPRNHVVQCRVYISDMEYWNEVNEVYEEFFGSHKPARVIVPVKTLHFGCLVEIEAVAEL